MELESTVSLERFFTNIQSLLKIIDSKPKGTTIEELFGKIFEYYLMTNDKNTEYNYEQLDNKMQEIFGEINIDKLIDFKYLFNAYNGAYDESFRRNGINDISDFDEEVKQAFDRLEKALGKTILETTEKNSAFITPNPVTLMKYAIRFIPERLWMGPLREGNTTSNNSSPIKIGETKYDYMMRIIQRKVAKLDISPEEKDRIIEDAKIVCKTFGSKRNKIAIIPRNLIENYKANWGYSLGGILQYDIKTAKPLKELSDTKEWNEKAIEEGGIRVFDKISPDKFETITILDKFELLQLQAVLAGANKGDYIDPNTGEVVEEPKKIIESEIPQVQNEESEDFSKIVEERISTLNKYKSNGTADLYEFNTEQGKNYIFKPATKKRSGEEELYRAYIQVAASQIQRLAQEQTYVDCRLATINDMKGIVEPKIQVDKQKTEALKAYYEKDEPLDIKIVKQLMREYVIDYCLCNYDSNYRNFVVDENGNVRGLDKEQAFKHIGDPQIVTDYRLEHTPGIPPDLYQVYPQSIYGKLFKDIEDGKIPQDVLLETLTAAKKILAIPENQYRRTFEKYAADVVEHNGGNKEQLLDNICKRRESLTTALEHIGLDKKLNRYSIQGKILVFTRMLNKARRQGKE